MTKIFRNARIYTPIDKGRPLKGEEMGRVLVIEDGAIATKEGYIVDIGRESDVMKRAPKKAEEIDMGGRCVIPGFVDPHTHACFVGTREKEFVMRLQGATYLEILEKGGGILSTVDNVRSASKEELYNNTKKIVMRALKNGVTTMEIKSGYGLSLEHEVKMLEVIKRLDGKPLDVVPTFMGAHAVPRESVSYTHLDVYKRQALAMDFLGIAVAELACISERRVARLIDHKLSGLPAFLMENSGVNSGFMIPQYVCAALVSENKVLAHPSSVDSIPTSANQEDHVSMGAYAARKGRTILSNAQKVIAIELLAAAQALDFSSPLKPGKGVYGAYRLIRKKVPFLEEDVFMAPLIEEVMSLVESGEIIKAVEEEIGELDLGQISKP